jgi:L-serine deaminase
MNVEFKLMADQVEKVERYYADKLQEPQANRKLKRHVEAMYMQSMAAKIEMQKVMVLQEILEKMRDKPIRTGYANDHY